MIEPDKNKDVWRNYLYFPGLLSGLEGRRVKKNTKFLQTVYKLGEVSQKNIVENFSPVRLPILFFATLYGCNLDDIPGNVMISKSLNIVTRHDVAIESLKKAKTVYTKEEIEKGINRDIDYLNVLKKAFKTEDFKVILVIINRKNKSAVQRFMKNFKCSKTTAAYYVDFALMPTIEVVMAGRKISYPDALLYQHVRWLYMDEKKKKNVSYSEILENEEW